MNKTILTFVLILYLTVAFVAADQIKLEVSDTGPFVVGGTFDITVYYNPDGTTEITELAFDIIDDPRIAEALVPVDGIQFTSATSAKLLDPNAGNGQVKLNGGWTYSERNDAVVLGCEGDDWCVGSPNVFNEILTISAEVTAIPDEGDISINFGENDLRAFDFNAGANIVPQIVYGDHIITFTRGGGDDVNHAPVFEDVADQQATVGEEFTLNIIATDEDSDVIRFLRRIAPGGSDLTDDGEGTATFTWTPTADDVGNAAAVTIDAFDPNGGVVSLEFTITVAEAGANVGPVFEDVADQQATVGEEFTLVVTATDANEDAVVIDLNVPADGIEIEDHGDGTATITWTPAADQLGNHTVSVDVWDPAGLSDNVEFTVTVADPNAGGGNGGAGGDDLSVTASNADEKTLLQAISDAISDNDTTLGKLAGIAEAVRTYLAAVE